MNSTSAECPSEMRSALAQLPDELKIEILKHLFASTKVMIKPPCQENNNPRRRSTKLPHLSFGAISRVSKEFCALSKPLYFTHTTFIFRQCFCPICVDVGELKRSRRRWCMPLGVQHLIWYRTDYDYDETTSYRDKKYFFNVEFRYLGNHLAPRYHDLKSLTLEGEWSIISFGENILRTMSPIKSLNFEYQNYLPQLHNLYYPIQEGGERTCKYEEHLSPVQVIDGNHVVLHSPQASTLEEVKLCLHKNEPKLRHLTFEWVKEQKHCMICGLSAWKRRQAQKCHCDQDDPYLKDKPPYEIWDRTAEKAIQFDL